MRDFVFHKKRFLMLLCVVSVLILFPFINVQADIKYTPGGPLNNTLVGDVQDKTEYTWGGQGYQVFEVSGSIQYTGYDNGSSFKMDICIGNSTLMWDVGTICWAPPATPSNESTEGNNEYTQTFPFSVEIPSLSDNTQYGYSNVHTRVDNGSTIASWTTKSRKVSVDTFEPQDATVTVGQEIKIDYIVLNNIGAPNIVFSGPITPSGNTPASGNGISGCPNNGLTPCTGVLTFTTTGPGQAVFELFANGPGEPNPAWSGFKTVSISNPPVETAIVACVVKSSATNQPINGATCSIAGQSGTTDGNGYKAFNGVIFGTYTLNVTASGFQDYSGSHQISGNIDIPVFLSPSSGGPPPPPPPGPGEKQLTVTINGVGGVAGAINVSSNPDATATSTITDSINIVTGGPGSLTAYPLDDSTFLSWGGDCVSFNGPPLQDTCSGIMDTNKNVIANFSGSPNPPNPPTDFGNVVITSNNQSAANYLVGPSCLGNGCGWNGSHTWTDRQVGTYNVNADPVAGYSVTVTPSSDVLSSNGTISFNINYQPSSGPGSQVSASCVVNVNPPQPNDPSNVTITEPNYCVSGPAATIGWTYSDSAGSPQTAYEVEMDEQGSFQSSEYDTGKVLSNSTSNFTGQGILLFGKTYKTRVRVWNGYDVVSGWTVVSGNFNTPQNAFPQVDFSWTANGILNNPSPPLNQPVQFTDQTVFNGNPNGREWSWTLGGGGTSTAQNPSQIYTAEGSYFVTLRATDNANQSCVRTKGPLIIQKAIPKWREVAPR